VETKPSRNPAIAKPIMKSATRKSTTLWLPFPISTNQLWRSGRGRVFKSSAYNTWISEADSAFLIQKKRLQPIQTIECKFAVSIVLIIDRFGKQDVDNSKVLLDFLQRVNLITNDKNCFDYHITWGLVEGDGCTIQIIELPDA